jgi:predicted dehydrogenase
MDKLRVAIVGCGTISWLHGPGYLQHPACEVAVLCDPVRQRAELRAKEWGISPRIYTSYEDVLNDSGIDAVELLTPTHLHAAQSVEALEAGKHVSCQKPMCNTVAEADSVIEAADRAKTTYRLVENFSYYPPIVKAMELLRSGAIGEPCMFRTVSLLGSERVGAELAMEPEVMEWRGEPGRNLGGLLFDDQWHKYATAIWMIGDVEKVSGVVTRPAGFYLEAPSAITWRFKDRNCLGLFEMIHATEMPIRGKYYPADDFIEIHGSKGVIWVTRCTGEMLDMPPVLVHSGTDTTAYDVPSGWPEGFQAASVDFVDCVLRGEQPRLDARTSKKVLQATLAAYRAAETETAVDPLSMTA